ncbi:MAG: hypothetical protein DMG14_29145 [Acidobacteria bacterium]|nr:MAG: hypothetical protein DMG14_29145 [Acidobacteriota bacterium]
MNAPHIHLLLNHFPTVGFSIGLGLFLVALFAKSGELKRASFVIFFMTAALTITTYVSGSDAQEAMKDSPGVSASLIAAHESAALVAFAFMQATGFFSWLGLWIFRRVSRVPNWNVAVVLILAVVTFGLMARAANIGGEILHPEIQSNRTNPAVQAEVEAEQPLAKSWGGFVENHSWVWPTAETLHFIGLSMLFGVVLTVDLRMLGIGKNLLSFAALYQLLPLGMLGFTVNLATGMVFFVATPQQYTGFLFFLKMMLVVVGAVNVLYFMLLEEPWTVGEGHDASITTKLVAASAIIIWIAVLFCGHMLPFYGNSF